MSKIISSLKTIIQNKSVKQTDITEQNKSTNNNNSNKNTRNKFGYPELKEQKYNKNPLR
tara:strand:+ start:456 stop:632 length:177 start_codon:yes stop_codon:yes gene_type:complete